MNLADRAAQIAARARGEPAPSQPDSSPQKPPQKPQQNEARATWFRITRDGSTFDVAFNPELTLPQAQEQYPFDTVERATA